MKKTIYLLESRGDLVNVSEVTTTLGDSIMSIISRFWFWKNKTLNLNGRVLFQIPLPTPFTAFAFSEFTDTGAGDLSFESRSDLVDVSKVPVTIGDSIRLIMSILNLEN